MDSRTPTSSIKGLCWPAIPSQQGAALLAMQFQLEQSQWWSPETLRAQQFKQLEGVLAHACRTVPYYRDSFKAVGFKPGAVALKDAWPQIPILKRADIQEAGDTLHSQVIPGEHGKQSKIWTSGSTGSPISVLGTGLTQHMWQAFTLREQLWHNRDLSAKLAVIRYFAEDVALAPGGASSDKWGPSTGQVYRTGRCEILNMASSIEQQAIWLQRHNPEYLLTFPSNLQALADYFIVHDLLLPNLRAVSTLSEAIGPDLRNSVRRAWGVELQDMYSTQEVGYIALQCPENEHYHVQSENALIEILNDNDEECAPGEVGRVVVTTLHNFATPLIRYEIGDYAEVGEECSCGRGLPVVTKILGRFRNMIMLPTGEQRWPILGYSQFEDIIDIRQIQTIQHSADEIEMKLVVNEKVSAEQEQQLIAVIRDSLGYPFQVRFSYVDEISRGKSGKYEEFICKHAT